MARKPKAAKLAWVRMIECQSGPGVLRRPKTFHQVPADEAQRMVDGGIAEHSVGPSAEAGDSSKAFLALKAENAAMAKRLEALEAAAG